MLFSKDMLEAVLEGRKTQTRRPVKDSDWGNNYVLTGNYADVRTERIIGLRCYANSEPFEHKEWRMKWQTNRTYAVCPGRGKKGVGRIKITRIRKERAIDITEDDARAEGFDNREAFFDKLRSLYGANVDLDALYWVLEFQLVQS